MEHNYQKKILSNARAIITNQIAIPLGVRKMCTIMTWAKNSSAFDNVDLSIFETFDKKIHSCPVGTERLLWDKDALKGQDKIIDKVLIAYRDTVLDKCFEIIEIFEKVK